MYIDRRDVYRYKKYCNSSFFFNMNEYYLILGSFNIIFFAFRKIECSSKPLCRPHKIFPYVTRLFEHFYCKMC